MSECAEPDCHNDATFEIDWHGQRLVCFTHYRQALERAAIEDRWWQANAP
ncbi:MAG TPA: hypothetical protein VLL25_17360 [Acidimicrobiales bacterium]|nr:hypothetical protein [Acidimicrobiales bacterium]